MNQFESVYERGLAVGHSNVRTDTMTFRFRDEVFELPTNKLHGIMQWNNLFYEARVDDLRRVEREQASGTG